MNDIRKELEEFHRHISTFDFANIDIHSYEVILLKTLRIHKKRDNSPLI